MKIINLLIGVVIGLATAFAGSYLFLELFTNYGFETGIKIMKTEGLLGKIITLGAILNLIAFFYFATAQKRYDGKRCYTGYYYTGTYNSYSLGLLKWLILPH